MKILKNNTERKCGQVMLEYVVGVAVFLAMVVVMASLLWAFKSYGGRILSLMAEA